MSHPPPRATRRALAILGAAGVLLGLGLSGAGPASAHASLVRVDPADGSSLTSAPAKVTLTFDENIGSPAVIVVTGPDGSRVSTGTAEVHDNTASTGVDITEGGAFTVTFRVVSDDGHPTSAQTIFRVTGGTTPANQKGVSSAPATTAASQPGPRNGADAPRRRTWFIGSVAGTALLGGLALLSRSRRGSPRRTRSRDPV